MKYLFLLAGISSVVYCAHDGASLDFKALLDEVVEECMKLGFKPSVEFSLSYSLLSSLERGSATLMDFLHQHGCFVTAHEQCSEQQAQFFFMKDACRDACHLLEATRYKTYQWANSVGIALTFMPQYDQTSSSNSITARFFFHDIFTDKNCLSIDTSINKHSYILNAALAGLVHCLPKAMIVWAPTISAYKRQYYDRLFPTQVGWSYDNPRTIIKVICDEQQRPSAFEVRGIDSLANPYAVCAVVLRAVLYALQGAFEQAEQCNADDCIEQAISYVPSSLEHALQHARENNFLSDWLGLLCIPLYAQYEKELSSFSQVITDWEKIRYYAL